MVAVDADGSGVSPVGAPVSTCSDKVGLSSDTGLEHGANTVRDEAYAGAHVGRKG